MAALWDELTQVQEPVLVVESYHHAAHAFYFEYFVEQGGRVTFLNNGEIKRRLSDEDGEPSWEWIGLEIPASIPAATLAEALTHSALFAAATAAMGHRGYMNIDAIVADDGRLIFNEVNARFGGGLVLHHIGARLLGPRYANDHILSSVRNVEPAPFTQTTDILRRRGALFDPVSGEGVVVVAHGPGADDNTECLIIAASRRRVRELEDLLEEAFAEAHQAKATSAD
ncbi:hypothetical protein ACZ91_64720 [Streptomyces regensis]|nr:hypothetical protein ACZ91_64720 [Streptomyces regensis]